MSPAYASNNDKRIKSGIKYALIKITYNGHCCTLEENLIEYVRSLLGVSTEEIEDCLINLKAKGDLVEEERDNGDIWVYLESFYMTEQNITNKIITLNGKLEIVGGKKLWKTSIVIL